MASSQLVTEGLITLFQLDCTMFPNGQWFYFSSAEDADTDINWGGLPYVAIPMEASGFEMTTTGAIPQPNITISNLYGAANTLLDEFKGLLGAKLVRILTLRRFLDDGATPDPNAYITRDVFVVSQKTSHNAIAIVFKLAAHIDQEGVMLPRRQVMRDYCSHTYRVWNATTGSFDYSKASCPWTASPYYDVGNNATDAPHDQCSRTRTGCQLRFGSNPNMWGYLPARFFPGVGRIR
jgi:lambda family phage minor tail protein L